MNWFDEHLHNYTNDSGYSQRLRIEEVIIEKATKYQHLLIFTNPYFGKVLALDGVIQVTEKDEFAYHEMLVHVPMLTHGYIKDVLIIGGGDGGTLREVCLHLDISSVTVVEIDQEVLESCRQYLPSISNGAFDHPKSTVVFQNGYEFIDNTKNEFDLIIVDSTDPIGPSEKLFCEKFYERCRSKLRSRGILVTQSGVPFMQKCQALNIHRKLEKIFEDTTFFLTTVPTYVGGYMALSWSSDYGAHREITLNVLEQRFEAKSLNTRYYSPHIHKASFVLPKFISDLLIR